MEVSGQFYLWGNSPQYLLDEGLGSPQLLGGRNLLSLLGIEL
jgi:hypothetical protein